MKIKRYYIGITYIFSSCYIGDLQSHLFRCLMESLDEIFVKPIQCGFRYVSASGYPFYN